MTKEEWEKGLYPNNKVLIDNQRKYFKDLYHNDIGLMTYYGVPLSWFSDDPEVLYGMIIDVHKQLEEARRNLISTCEILKH